jgi:hypothetical protein
MTINDGTNTITIDPPQFGYASTISLPFTVSELDNGHFQVWDDGLGFQTYDIRYCDCAVFVAQSMMNSLLDILEATSKGRSKQLTIGLGSTATGFFPFGPDKGDKGDFIVTLVSMNQKASIGHPEDYFPLDVRLACTGAYPVYVLPSQIDDGSLQIGTIQKLRFPQSMHEQDFNYRTNEHITQGADAFTNSRGEGSDKYVINLALDEFQPNMAALINHIVGTVRANTVRITPPSNSWLSGALYSDSYIDAKMITKDIKIIHRKYNDFGVNLSFAKV